MTESSTITPGYVVTLLRGRVYLSHDIRFEIGAPVVITDENIVEDLADDYDVVRGTNGEIFHAPRFDVKYYQDISSVQRKLNNLQVKDDARKAKRERLASIKNAGIANAKKEAKAGKLDGDESSSTATDKNAGRRFVPTKSGTSQ